MSAERYTVALIILLAVAVIFLMLFLQYRKRYKAALHQQEALARRATHMSAELARIQRQLAATKLVSLKSQVNPHFLFNCLNGIHNAIITGEDSRAHEYISGLARMLRMVLVLSDKHFISLKEEIDLLEYYLRLERLRTNNAFEYTIRIDPEIATTATLVPGMLIQPFLENAIWHGLMNKEDGPRQLLVQWRLLPQNLLLCEVEDNGIGRHHASRRNNEGLKSGYQSKGIELCMERMELYRTMFNSHCHIEIEDLFGETQQAGGTRVSITFEIDPAMAEVSSGI
ncbi:sensor histidine kinase [Chitinophaga vietnamensis]|uniref:sensor histidine kinase n=1 Tax=Chitinophaga vietnamensis TaxID=2593957 RepID=UPI001178B420|nr:sensor histidine kinase [Chitinophaga vietnamensis]